ncbi:MAG TPA: class I SAM-dependent methyltransferase [Chitinophagaceae bacterium]|nr:class I SAM-dependent methyltransferase [Chitinophagaceae bacterium]
MSKDLFSAQANVYAKYRPVYPAALFDHILQFVDQKDTAWDCATGNGQAAIALAPYFKKVIATDISEKQLSLAKPYANIQYRISAAEQTNFGDNSFDLITVAQAYHWLKFETFEEEVKRVAKKDAVIAVWGYNLFSTNDPAIDALIQNFYADIVGPYWDKERKYVDDNYSSVPFNFAPLPTKQFFIKSEWSKDDVVGYLNSWSSVQHFIDTNKCNPVDDISSKLDILWKAYKGISFPLFLKLGRIH